MPSDDDLDRDRDRHLDQIEADLAGVELALSRLDAGTYFRCETCGAELPLDALAETPTLHRCPEHAAP
jgi:RNA polymerase-binding transcription factor DksA